MKINIRWTGLAALLLIALIGIRFLLESVGSSDATPLQKEHFGIRWQDGISQNYNVEMHSTMQLKGAGTTQLMQVDMNSILQLHTLEADSHSALVGIHLSDVSLDMSGHKDPETAAALQTPFRVRFVSGGIPQHFEFPETVNAQERGMLENLVRAFQVYDAPDSISDTWIAEETNASGRFQAEYQRSNTNVITKRKRDFVAAKASAMFADANIASDESIQLDAKLNWIACMNIKERIESKGQSGPSMTIENHASIELITGTLALSKSVDWNFVATVADPVSPDSNPAIARLSAVEAKRQLVAAIPELDTTNKGRSKHIHTLRDLLRNDASIPSSLLEQMREQEFSDRTRADLYLALELAGTESAQAALTEVIQDRSWSTKDGMRALVALGGVRNPSDATLDVLWDTTNSDNANLASTATFALGSVGNTIKHETDSNYASIRDGLLSGALSSDDAQQRSNYILAVGNTHDKEVAADIANLLDDSEPDVRRAAAMSLAKVGTDESGELLLERFKKEDHGEIRGAIAASLASLSSANEDSMKTVGKALTQEKNENARYNMANYIGKNLKDYPEYKTVLENLRRQEPSKRVRDAISEALALAKSNAQSETTF